MGPYPYSGSVITADETGDPMLHKIPISELKGIGPARTRCLNKLGVQTVADLLLLAPRRYEDWTTTTPIAVVKDRDLVCVRGTLVHLRERQTSRKNLVLTTAVIDDGTGQLEAVWFTRYHRGGSAVARKLSRQQQIALLGTVSLECGRPVLKSPEFRLKEEDNLRLNPVYPLTEGLTQKVIREAVQRAWLAYGGDIGEYIPPKYLADMELVTQEEAIRMLHFPSDEQEVRKAWRRLAFDELFLLQLVLLRKHHRTKASTRGIAHNPDGPLVKRYLDRLPFPLTDAQKKAIQEIRRDMERPVGMRRLLQGDVGSGKTVVALYAIVKAVESGYQAAFMVPTEVLAEQHFSSMARNLQVLGITVRLFTGRTSGKERVDVLRGLADGSVQAVVGTHALIQDNVKFARLGLAVIDEQHRFGVQQRQVLPRPGTDLLVMTATPIPRTLALTLYGDMDLTVMDELPPGRKPVDTRWIAQRDRPQVYRFIQKQVQMGRQVYVVCPIVQPNDEKDVKAAVVHSQELARALPDLRIGLLHGQMPYEEKAATMEKFCSGQIDILVTTTVIEVGIDVPNASVMVIENAERFGLSQLHQLRGRVGRGPHQSYCLLMANPTTDIGRERLDVMRRVSDGFQIAEADLRLRGPGELLGFRQSGFPEFKFASITDVRLLECARKAAVELVAQTQAPEFTFPPSIEVELLARGYA